MILRFGGKPAPMRQLLPLRRSSEPRHGRGRSPGAGGPLGRGWLLRTARCHAGCHTRVQRGLGSGTAGPLGGGGCVAVRVAMRAARGVLQWPKVDVRARVWTFLDGMDRPEKRKVGGSTPPLPTTSDLVFCLSVEHPKNRYVATGVATRNARRLPRRLADLHKCANLTVRRDISARCYNRRYSARPTVRERAVTKPGHASDLSR